MLVSARFSQPVERYGHFALGRPHEYARLEARTDTNRVVVLELGEDEVFEDLEPRLVRLSATDAPELLVIVSNRTAGARVALLRLAEGRLVFASQSPAIGTPMRWLNVAAVADLDGDGRAEVAVVTTPHIGGTLRVYRREGTRLSQIAALAGFSNHAYGSPELRLSEVIRTGGRLRLALPDSSRQVLRVVALEDGRLVETGRCTLGAQVTGPLRMVGAVLEIGLASGPHRIDPARCAEAR